MIVIKCCKTNEIEYYCCIFGHFNLLYYGKLDDTMATTGYDAFAALHTF